MSYDLEDFVNEFNELSYMVDNAEYRYVPGRLKQFINFLLDADPDIGERMTLLMRRLSWDEMARDFIKPMSGMVGSGEVVLPDKLEDRLCLNLHIFQRLGSGDLDLLAFSRSNFVAPGNNVNSTVQEMLSQLFRPFTTELRRYISRTYDEPLSGGTHEESVPASDRIVTLNHNSVEYQEADAALADVEARLLKSNHGDPDEKKRVVAEIGAVRRLLNSTSVRLGALGVLAVHALKWTANVFAETTVGTAATWAITKLVEYVPLLASFFS